MDTKLTVRLPQELLANAKRYAQRHDTTLTRLILNYLQRIPVEEPDLANAPLVRGLTGIIAPDLSIADYRKHIEDKYGLAHGAD
ncbi:MAG: DUF6364 family protein [Anaerolineae bacterium]